jgi:hypothetical protein
VAGATAQTSNCISNYLRSCTLGSPAAPRWGVQRPVVANGVVTHGGNLDGRRSNVKISPARRGTEAGRNRANTEVGPPDRPAVGPQSSISRTARRGPECRCRPAGAHVLLGRTRHPPPAGMAYCRRRPASLLVVPQPLLTTIVDLERLTWHNTRANQTKGRAV